MPENAGAELEVGWYGYWSNKKSFVIDNPEKWDRRSNLSVRFFKKYICSTLAIVTFSLYIGELLQLKVHPTQQDLNNYEMK